MNDLYDKIRSKCQTERSDLVDSLTPNFGYGYFIFYFINCLLVKIKLTKNIFQRFLTGIEFREPNYIISNKCTAVLKAGIFI